MTHESGEPDPTAPSNKAFAAQRHRINELERSQEELQRKLDEQEFSGDPEKGALIRQMREMQKQIDNLSMQNMDNEQVEIVLAEYPWIKSIGNKMDRIQAVKDIIARDQRAATNAGDPQNTGRSRSEAVTYAHVTGGGPSATGASGRSDEEREEAEYNKAMGEAKTQAERDALVDAWSKRHPGDGPVL